MIRNMVFAVAIAAGTLAYGGADATVLSYTYTSSSSVLRDLDGSRYYKWGMNWGHTNEYITGAVLTLNNVYASSYGEDVLYIHLLNNSPFGTTSYHDNQSGGDRFVQPGLGHGRGLARRAMNSSWIGTWDDPYGDPDHRTTLVYDLGNLGLLPTLRTFAADGQFGFGFDPDSDFSSDQFEVTLYTDTAVVPEPTTIILLGVGLFGLVAVHLRRNG